MLTFSVIYVDMKCVTPRVGRTDIQSDQGLQFQELLYATKKSERVREGENINTDRPKRVQCSPALYQLHLCKLSCSVLYGASSLS